MKTANSIFKIFLVALLLAVQVHFAYAQTAALLPVAPQQFFDKNGNPVTSGSVGYYIPGTSTPKMVWQDDSQTTPWSNPITLNAGGWPPNNKGIYGSGTYRQIIKDKNNNIISDQPTSATGSGGGSGTSVGDGNSVGTILTWSGMIAPNQYQFAYGQALSRSTYPELYQAVTLNTNITCVGGNTTLTGISDTNNIPIGANVEGNCIVAGSTVISKTINTVTLSIAANISTTTSARFFPYGNGNGTTTFNAPDLRGKVIPGRTNMGGVTASNLTNTYYGSNPDAVGANGGTQSSTLAQSNLPNVNFNVSIPSGQGAHTHNVNNVKGQGAYPAQPGGDSSASQVTANFTTTSSTLPAMTGTAPSGGSGTAFSLVQPSMTLNYIIKVTPDTSVSGLFGVASIGGMQGIITCGTGITCAGNDISVTPITTIDATSVTYTQSSVSAVLQTAQRKLDTNPISPQDFSLTAGNGSSDDTAALQAMFNAYTTQGRNVYVPDGTYNISSTVIALPPITTAPVNQPPPRIILGKYAKFVATSVMTDMLQIGSTSPSFNGLVRGGLLEGGYFECNNKAATAIHWMFVQHSVQKFVNANNCTGASFKAGTTTAPQTSYGMIYDSNITTRIVTPFSISAITNANPAVVSATGHPYVNGEKVTIENVGGMTQINNLTFIAANVVPGVSFELQGINSTGYGVYTSGGLAYGGFAPAGSSSIYWENTGDSHAINNMLTGSQLGITGSAGCCYDGKYTNNHIWNFLNNGEILYAFDLGGDNDLVGNQVDGPFHYAYRFSDLRNTLAANNVNYTPLTYGGVDNYAYPILLETGAGVTAVGNNWKAQSASARLAGPVTGDLSNYNARSTTYLNMVVAPNETDIRLSSNSTLLQQSANYNNGAAAAIQSSLSTDAGNLNFKAFSAAGGGAATFDWTGSGGVFWQAGTANSHHFQTNYTDRLVIGGTSVTAAVPYIAPVGSVSSPSYTFSGRTTDGIYSPAAGQLGFTIGGVQVNRFLNASGLVQALDSGGSSTSTRWQSGSSQFFVTLFNSNFASLSSNGAIQYLVGPSFTESMRLLSSTGIRIGSSGADPGALNLGVDGAVATAIPVTKTGTSSTIGASDSSIIYNASGTHTTTLPSAATFPGRWLYVKSIAAQAVNSASSNVVPRTTATAGTAILASGAGNWANLQSDGTNWVIMSGN